jgi:hypothetical protein
VFFSNEKTAKKKNIKKVQKSILGTEKKAEALNAVHSL